ncbi:ankyrin repeat-containing domain protein [Microdochium bolleyi]|uniref:Ankyrin repeat-containing domain protein n=1 Tax=Microdochium bolleyi TaxID=196109 RepID=A0A136IZV9_9PEZI|nr:ankyrin repeat-containing domain protein [Microdochium bolleyi]
MDASSYDQLISAAAEGNLSRLQQYCQAHKQDASPETAREMLKAAVVESQPSVVEFLLQEFPQLELNDEIVHAAACKGSPSVFSLLLARDSSIVNKRLERIGTPLSSACRTRRPVEFLRYLLEQGADPNKRPEAFGYPLALAATRYDDTNAVDLFLEHGARREHSGALAAASALGKETMVEYLLGKGLKPDTDAREIAGDHPLHAALMGGHVGAAKILLHHGASVDVLNRNGKSLQEMADLLQSKGEDRTEFMTLLSKAGEDRARS